MLSTTFLTMIDFADVLVAALLVGAMFSIWLILNPAGLAAGVYIRLQQHAIRTLNRPMPILGGVTILLTILASVVRRDDSSRFVSLVVAVICFVSAGLITRFLNQPINAIVIRWRADAPPPDWTGIRDEWWRWHVLRLFAGLGGLSLVIAAMLHRA